MTFADFALVEAGNAAALYLFHHFRANPAKLAADLDFIKNLETRIQTMISDAMTNALANLKTAAEAAATEAAARSLQPALDAQDGENVAAVNALAAELTPAPAG